MIFSFLFKIFVKAMAITTMITSNTVNATNEIKDYSFIKNSGDNKWYEEVFGTWYSSNDRNEYIFFQINFPWISYYGQGNCAGSVALLDNKIHFKFGNGYIGPYKYFTYQDHKMFALYPDDTVIEFIRDEKKFPVEKRKMLMKQLKLSEIDVIISGPNNYKLTLNYKATNPNSVIKDGTVTVKTENTQYQDQEINFIKLNASHLLDLIVENDVSEWEKLPLRDNITSDEYQADVTVKFTNKEFKFSSKQKLPNTKALFFQRLYASMLSPIGSKFNPYFEHTIGEPEEVQYAYIRDKKNTNY